MPRLGLQIDAPLPVDRMVEVVRAANDRGLEICWFHEGQDWDAFTYLSAVAVRTEGVRLGTAVISAFTRSPGLVGLGAATLHHVSGGRFTLGIGSSHQRLIEVVHQIPYDKPITRTREYVEIVRRLLTGESVTYRGKACGVDGLRIQAEGAPFDVPIYMGVVGTYMARIAGRIADGVILHLADKDHVGRIREAIAEGAREAGRDPSEIDVGSFIMCVPDRDEAQARSDIIDAIAFYAWLDRYRNHYEELGYREQAAGFKEAWERGDSRAAASFVTEDMLDQLPVAAGYDRTKERVEEFRAAGVDLPILYPFPPREGYDEDRYIQSIIDAMDGATE